MRSAPHTMPAKLTLSDSLFAALRPRRDRLTPFDQADFDAIDGFLHGETEKALVAARQLVNLAKGSQRAHFRLGWAALNAQRYHESVQAFRHVTDLPGWMNNWPHFYFWITQAYHSLGDHEVNCERSGTDVRSFLGIRNCVCSSCEH